MTTEEAEKFVKKQLAHYLEFELTHSVSWLNCLLTREYELVVKTARRMAQDFRSP